MEEAISGLWIQIFIRVYLFLYYSGLIYQLMKPDKRERPNRLNRPDKRDRPDGSGPDPCGLGITYRSIISASLFVIPAKAGIQSQPIARRVFQKGRAIRGPGWY